MAINWLRWTFSALLIPLMLHTQSFSLYITSCLSVVFIITASSMQLAYNAMEICRLASTHASSSLRQAALCSLLKGIYMRVLPFQTRCSVICMPSTRTHTQKVRKLKYRINKKDKWKNTLLLKILKDFLYAHQGHVSWFRVPSWLPLLSCHVRQLVVWAISTDRAAGVHGSQADSSPPVAHFPFPLYIPVFYTSFVSRLLRFRRCAVQSTLGMAPLNLCFNILFYVFLLSLFTRITSALCIYDRRTLLDIGHHCTNLLQDTLSTDPAWPLEILRSTEVNDGRLNNPRRRRKHRGRRAGIRNRLRKRASSTEYCAR